MYHLLRADEFDASRAKELGFVQEVVSSGSQLERAKEIASKIYKANPLNFDDVLDFSNLGL